MGQIWISDPQGKHVRLLVQDSNLVVNWADFPNVGGLNENPFFNSIVSLNSDVGYHYGGRLNVLEGKKAKDQGWLHEDLSLAEHGFFSFTGNNAFWLDGRNFALQHDAAHHESQLRWRDLSVSTESFILDERVCDCCSIASLQTEDGILVAYRNRDEQEVRDIYVVDNFSGEWSLPRSLSHEKWEINACPVNGPTLAGKGKTVLAAWFGVEQGQTMQKYALSFDSGLTFSERIIPVSPGMNPLGRLHSAYDARENVFYLSFMEGKQDSAHIVLAKITADFSFERLIKFPTTAKRRSGFPQLALHDRTLFMAATFLDEKGSPRVEVHRLDLNSKSASAGQEAR